MSSAVTGDWVAHLGDDLEKSIGEALDKGDWARVEELAAGLANEFSLKGMEHILKTYLTFMAKTLDAAHAKQAAQIQEAIGERSAGKVRELLAKKKALHRPWHDAYVDFMATIQSQLVKTLGQDALREGLHEVGESMRGKYEITWKTSAADQARTYARSFRNHLGNLNVREDEEKFTFVHNPCGSGGRLLRKGAYEGENALARVSEPEAMTAGRRDFQSYCTHCPAWLQQQHEEWFGAPQWVVTPPKKPEDPCVFHIYKDKSKAPKT